jgi:hypothetical protein
MSSNSDDWISRFRRANPIIRKDVEPLLDKTRKCLYVIGIDFGSSKSKFCHGILDQDTPHDNLKRCDKTKLYGPGEDFLISDIAIKTHRDNNGQATHHSLVFNRDIQEELERETIFEEDVIRAVKVEVIGENGLELCCPGDADAVHQLQKENKDRLNKFKLPLKVEVQYPGEPLSTKVIRKPKDLLVIALRYLWLTVVEDVKVYKGFNTTQFEELLANKVAVEVSIPTAWRNETIEAYIAVLIDAGFPDCTTTLSESKNAAIFNLIHDYGSVEAAENGFAKQKSRKLVVVDIGKMTADVSVILSWVEKRRVKVGEPVLAIGSLAGSHALDRIFVKRCREWMGSSWNDLVHQLENTFGERGRSFEDADLERVLALGFEKAKEKFEASETAIGTTWVKLPGLRLPPAFSIPEGNIGVCPTGLEFQR